MAEREPVPYVDPLQDKELSVLLTQADRVPENSLLLVNAAFNRSFPRLAGLLIPKIRSSDVYVLGAEQQSAFSKRADELIAHPEGNRITKDLGRGKDDFKYPGDFTHVYLAGSPIILQPITDIPSIAQSDHASELYFASILTHEYIHKVARSLTIPANPHEPMFDLAISSDLLSIHSMKGKGASKKAWARYMEYVNFIANNNPLAITTGAVVSLWCDSDKSKKKVASTGERFEEGVVQILDRSVKAALESVAFEVGYPDVRGELASVIDDNTEIQLAQNILEKLGLNDPNSIMTAYIQGGIPNKYAEIISTQLYLG